MIQRGIIIPDVHDDKVNEKAFRAVCEFTKDFKPHHFIQLGDFSNCDSLGKHALRNPDDFISFTKEKRLANARMDQLERYIPKNCSKFMTGGNHEDRHNDALVEKFNCSSSRKKAMIDIGEHWSEMYNLDLRGWDYCEYGEYYNVGKLYMTHGWFATKAHADMASTSAQIPGRSIICAHNHKHHVFNCNDEKGRPLEVESIGTLSRFDLSYLRNRKPVDWVNMFVFFYMRPNGTFTKYPVFIIDGKFIFNGKEY